MGTNSGETLVRVFTSGYSRKFNYKKALKPPYVPSIKQILGVSEGVLRGVVRVNGVVGGW
jgi:hypothetical protein